MDEHMEPTQYRLQDYIPIFRRRRWELLVPTITLLTITALIAIYWPPTYKSTATILIEEPNVPRDLVSSAVTSFADQQLQFISQKVMTKQNLVSIIDRLNLYANDRNVSTSDGYAESLRRGISLKLVKADFVDKKSYSSTPDTLSFSLSYEHRVPETAQSVVDELVSLYLLENLRTRRKQTGEATGFLTTETAKLDAHVRRLANELANFKEQNAGNLPDNSLLSQQTRDRTELELIESNRLAQSLSERRIFLEAELAQVSRFDSLLVDGRRVLSPAEQLRAKQTELISLQGVYGPKHPDVIKLSREIDALKSETGAGTNVADLVRQLDNLQTDMAVARKKYAASHPDVLRLQRQISTTKAALSVAENAPATAPVATEPDNPTYIQLRAQLEAIKSQLRAVASQRSALRARLKVFDQRAVAAPQIERTYARLQQDYESALANFRNVSAKRTAALLAQALEAEQAGGQFSVIEPANLPFVPFEPNRRAILVIGIFLSVAVGVGSAALFERMDQSVYGAAQLEAIVGSPPLIVVPHIRSRADSRQFWGRAGLLVLGALAVVILGNYLVQKYLLPLDTQGAAQGGLAGYLASFIGK
jgi:succinoglycan biosynthesis transport protein ExoP